MKKEEIGKLLELLNEYDDGGWQIRINDIEPIGCDVYAMSCGDSIEHCIISKSYGFIQRLVEQDKIELEAGPLYGCQLIMHNRQPYTLYETLLMLLAISDTPIEDLISYLK